jgi:hypothetical protein
MIYSPSSGTPPANSTIGLCTRKGNKIENSQLLSLHQDAHFKEQLRKLRLKFIGVKERPETISGIYNCHGMTFANRRTGIEKDQEVVKIISEDDYKELTDLNDVMAGDIVFYYTAKGEIDHSGIVISPPENNLFVGTAVILSKWGIGFEAIHTLYNCPYELNNIKFYRCIH